MRNRELYVFIRSNATDMYDSTIHEKLLQFTNLQIPTSSQQISKFCNSLRKRWINANRTQNVFEKSNISWLDKEFLPTEFTTPVSNIDPTSILLRERSRGRPAIPFDEASERSRRRKIANIKTAYSSTELLGASASCLRDEGKIVEAKCLTDAARIYTQYNGDDALALLLDANLTKSSYQLLRNQAVNRGSTLYPSYHYIREAKKQCYPQSIEVSDFKAEVVLQSLLDHTALRLCEVQMSVLEASIGISRLTLRYKWGFDGASGQNLYKQIANFEESNFSDEENLFITCVVPLELAGFGDKSTVVWRNPKPSSTQFCRPLRFQFKHESQEVIKEEEAYVQNQINHLQDTQVQISHSRFISVSHILQLTMIDGKVHTALSDATNSTLCCSICGISPKDINKLEKVSATAEQPSEAMKFGLSTLHAWIRFFECLLHISYRLTFKRWQVRGSELQDAMKEHKSIIQKEFRTKLGLIIDRPKAGGSGTSNDGNTARTAFKNFEITSQILNLDKGLVYKFYVILCTLSCGYDVHPQRFKKFCLETAKLFVELYPWYFMPQSVHKILIHGYLVIEKMALPIGMMSEEAQECTNKNFKKFREHFSRKCSRSKTNTDLMNRLLASSDPKISSLRNPISHKTFKSLPLEAQSLLSSDMYVPRESIV